MSGIGNKLPQTDSSRAATSTADAKKNEAAAQRPAVEGRAEKDHIGTQQPTVQAKASRPMEGAFSSSPRAGAGVQLNRSGGSERLRQHAKDMESLGKVAEQGGKPRLFGLLKPKDPEGIAQLRAELKDKLKQISQNSAKSPEENRLDQGFAEIAKKVL